MVLKVPDRQNVCLVYIDKKVPDGNVIEKGTGLSDQRWDMRRLELFLKLYIHFSANSGICIKTQTFCLIFQNTMCLHPVASFTQKKI